MLFNFLQKIYYKRCMRDNPHSESSVKNILHLETCHVHARSGGKQGSACVENATNNFLKKKCIPI